MYLIKTSFHIDSTHASGFVDQLRAGLAGPMEKSGIFSDTLLLELLIDIDPALKAFSLQAKAESLDDSMKWIQNDAASFFEMLMRQYGSHVAFFTTPMKIL